MDVLSEIVDEIRGGTLNWESWAKYTDVPVIGEVWPLAREAHVNQSIDAAVKLLELTIPDAEYWVNSKHYWGGTEGPVGFVSTGTPGIDLEVEVSIGNSPSESLLLATLQMIIRRQKHDGIPEQQ